MPISWAMAKAWLTSTICRPDSGDPKVDGCADGHASHVLRLLHAGEGDLVELVGKGEELVVVELHHEWNSMGVLPVRPSEARRGCSRRHCIPPRARA